ncbi:hypothetical protein Pan44_02660 [Caulifigura coniformis]|uniref:DUF1254 domain-containing protein n=1 Tax=Caulifigura coniformis TaxID=2527983 RepID=A0A517S815_9PLAN|nr:DUF1254 domain-containing protein [Caulifigura coniformis]QDT52257.1 hypothetical protein Pan44_02660 [Caulifigura coniformis]
MSRFIQTVGLILILAAQAAAQNIPPLMKQINNGNWLDQKDAESFRDELFYQRACQVYMSMLPALNVIGMKDGSEKEFGAGYNVLPIWKDRMDSRCWVPTPNADVIYSMSYLDLKQDGPLVVAAPPNVIGMFTDFFQRTLTDVGAIGPDRARGGLYLILPPNYDGPRPAGYFTVQSSTYNVFLFFRTVMAKGDGKPDPKPAVANAEQTRVYPLWAPEKDVKPMQFPNASGKRLNMMYPVDNSYWTKLKEFVDYEPISAIDMRERGALAAIGIIKGQPFKPTEREQELLKKAVENTPKMLLALRQLGRPDGRQLYYKDRQYENAWSGATSEDFQESYFDVNLQAAYYQYVYSSAPAMAMRTINAGSKYPFTTRDAKGEHMNGSNTYKLHMPPNPPAALFWAVTAYNVTDGTMPETDQLMPSTNGYYDIPKNPDGSIDIWFGPKKPDGVADAAFIKTVPNRNFLVALRLYGSGIEFYDQTWKPDDVVKVK